MARIALLYGTTEGQTAAIAERMAETLDAAGHDATLVDLEHQPVEFTLSRYDAAVLGASAHGGNHQKHVERYARRHADVLTALPSAFFSVSSTAAEGTDEAWGAARETLQQFVDRTRWTPDMTAVVPGRATESHYGPLKRFVLQRIARRRGDRTDAATDGYTDWDAAEAFAREFVAHLR
jgi:menaquinone-dependent protoporphyrinogen oxidase